MTNVIILYTVSIKAWNVQFCRYKEDNTRTISDLLLFDSVYSTIVYSILIDNRLQYIYTIMKSILRSWIVLDLDSNVMKHGSLYYTLTLKERVFKSFLDFF